MSRDLKNNRPAVFVDVDGTLAHWTKKGDKFNVALNYKLAEQLNDIRNSDSADVILWSRRGGKYAKQIAKQLNVTLLFDAIIGKPTTIIDDEGLGWMKGVRVQKK